MPDYIPSPYNFVPLSKDVFFPDWADMVSMDVPFSDGISGTIQIKVTAKTPIYIRNGGAHPEEQRNRLNDANYKDFFRVYLNGPYAIPGTSIKGMLRNVIEIASFGKIAGSSSDAARVSDHRYAIRDLQNSTLYGNHITGTVSGAYKPKVKAAWLKQGGGNKWELRFCDFARVEQTDLERYLKGGSAVLANRQLAGDKYNQIAPYTQIDFDCGPETTHQHSSTRLIYRKASNLGRGQEKGIIVLTGQPAPRDGRSGKKHMEFIFFNIQPNAVTVPDPIKKDFIFAHSELGENRQPNKEWAFWKDKMDKGKEIPLFVLMNGNNISSMGLAMMYRLPYKHSIHQTIEHTAQAHLDGRRLDMAELIFGRIEDKDALRGRVSIETLIAQGQPRPIREVKTVLNGPKPTYYPNYVKQNPNANGVVANYKTYMDIGAEIRGWKRYIIRPDSSNQPQVNDAPTDNVATKFTPLPAGTVFTGVIHVHNLLPQELGALIWAITWGGDTNLRHNIGMGKPYGFGSVSVAITESQLRWCDRNRKDSLDTIDCQKKFIKIMDTFLNSSWIQSEAINALKAMANPNMRRKNDLRYPILGRGAGNNDFVSYKNAKLALVSPFANGNTQGGGNPGKHETQKKEDLKSGAKHTEEQTPSSAPSLEDLIKQKGQAEGDKPDVDGFLKKLDSMSIGDISKEMKKCKLEIAKVSPDEKKKIYQELQKKQKKLKSVNQELKKIIEKWKC